VPYLADEARLLQEAVDSGVPVLGICFGAQLLARVLGGDVQPIPGGPEIGWIRVDSDDHALVNPGPWLIWHFDMIIPPPGADDVAHSPGGTQVFTCGPHVGVQFHPEATVWSVTQWAQTYDAELARLGITADQLIAETRRLEYPSRVRGHALFDRVLDRSRQLHLRQPR
jgi:GMP synthase-like glutamine amidotransferase